MTLFIFLQRSGLGCSFRGLPVCVILYADDIMLISPSVCALQEMIFICEEQLSLLEMALNPKKSVCLRFGPRFDQNCASLQTLSGLKLSWVQTCRYLGVYLQSSRTFKCCFKNAKRSYFRSFNSVFGKVGRQASDEVVLHLIVTKCFPVILYGLDVCPVNSSDRHYSFAFVLKRCLMKLFNTGSNIVVTECRHAVNVKLLSDTILIRKLSFLYRFCKTDNFVCKLFVDIAKKEIFSIGSLIKFLVIKSLVEVRGFVVLFLCFSTTILL